MAARRLFMMRNKFAQAGHIGICTVIALYWAKTCLEHGRGLGSFDELLLTQHQLNGLMAKWGKLDNNPTAQTEGMGLKIVGTDHEVNSIEQVRKRTSTTEPHVSIFWNSHHTMGFRTQTHNTRGKQVQDYEFFDNEEGLWLASGATAEDDIKSVVVNGFVSRNYHPISGMRVVKLPDHTKAH